MSGDSGSGISAAVSLLPSVVVGGDGSTSEAGGGGGDGDDSEGSDCSTAGSTQAGVVASDRSELGPTSTASTCVSAESPPMLFIQYRYTTTGRRIKGWTRNSCRLSRTLSSAAWWSCQAGDRVKVYGRGKFGCQTADGRVIVRDVGL